jgi:hypothetical protein
MAMSQKNANNSAKIAIRLKIQKKAYTISRKETFLENLRSKNILNHSTFMDIRGLLSRKQSFESLNLNLK